MFIDVTPEIILEAYHQGIFPMAENSDSLYFNFYRPNMRGQLPINQLHISKKLMKILKNNAYKITVDKCFSGVIEGCSAVKNGRENTWINKPIRNVFLELHDLGYAHSVECWHKNKLVGGLYGLAIGAVFCGESMFSTMDDASKVALVHLCARLSKGGFTVLDTQFTNDHLEQFGVYEIPQEKYEKLIKKEMKRPADFILRGIDEEKLLNMYLDTR